MIKCIDLYADQGIEVSGKKICAGEKATLAYRGLLALSGADRVFVHYGYGDSWSDQGNKEMELNGDGFVAELELKMPGSLNVCFRDSAGNWDNNSSKNYTFAVSAKKLAGRSRKAVSAV